MNNHKIYKKGNYLFIVDMGKQPNVYYRGVCAKVEVDKNNLNKPIYRFYNIKDWDSSKSLNLAQIFKEDGSSYTESEFDTFWQDETGNFNGGGSAPTYGEVLTNGRKTTETAIHKNEDETQFSYTNSDGIRVAGSGDNPLQTSYYLDGINFQKNGVFDVNLKPSDDGSTILFNNKNVIIKEAVYYIESQDNTGFLGVNQVFNNTSVEEFTFDGTAGGGKFNIPEFDRSKHFIKSVFLKDADGVEFVCKPSEPLLGVDFPFGTFQYWNLVNTAFENGGIIVIGEY